MTANIMVLPPYQPFTLPGKLGAVFNGYVWCGVVDKDPLQYPVQVYVVNEDGSQTEVRQPLRINSGGFLVYNGIPAQFVTGSNHSLLVQDSLKGQVWYEPDMSVVNPRTAMAILGSQSREALRRSYASAGYNLVNGSFEAGGTITSPTDALLHESSGIAYTGPSGVIAPGTNPDSGGFESEGNNITLRFDKVSDMLSYKAFYVGQKVAWMGYHELSDGGGNWGVVKSGAHVNDGGSIFSINQSLYIEANLTNVCRISVLKFGAVGDGDGSAARRESNSASIKNLVSYLKLSGNVKMHIPRGKSGSRLFTLNEAIKLARGITLTGDGMMESVVNVPSGSDGVIIYSDCSVKDIGFEMVTDNSDINSRGVLVQGDTDNRPVNVFVSRVFASDFYIGFESNYMWASVVKSLYTRNTRRGVLVNGLSVNNTLKTCQLLGRSTKDDDAAIKLGDGGVASEGWMLTNNLTFGFGIGLHLSNFSHCVSTGNIYDFCYNIGVLLSGASINNKFNGDYIGMSAGASTGFYGNNSRDDVQSKGNKLSQSDIVAYGRLDYGILLSGYEHGAKIDRVSVDACAVNSIKTEAAPKNVSVTNCNFRSNNAYFTNNGLSRESLVTWHGNTGGLQSSLTTIKFPYGAGVARYSPSLPTNGEYFAGDVAINTLASDTSAYGWVCTSAGDSGNAQFKRIAFS